MPELPEVETVCRGIAPILKGASITKVKVLNPKLRIPIPKSLTTKLKGAQIKQVIRKAKYILIYLDNSYVVVIHLGMSGRLRFMGTKSKALKHDHLMIYCHCEEPLGDDKILVYNDTRKFGLVTLVQEDKINQSKLFNKLGLEPLSQEFTAEVLYKILKARNKSVKSVLMDANIIVGIGNIYACEALFSAGIRPTRLASKVSKAEASKLYDSIVATLNRAIEAGGSTLRDYRQASGDTGYFQHEFYVYDQNNNPCRQCQTPIQRIKQNGRSSYYCKTCQK